MKEIKILVVDDDSGLRLSLKNMLESQNFIVEEAENGQTALEKIAHNAYSVVFLDVDMPKMTGLELLKRLQQPHCSVIVMTAFANIKDAVEAVQNGALDYIQKPIKEELIFELLDKALQAQKAINSVAVSAPKLLKENNNTIIGSSSGMKKVFNLVQKLARVETPVLIRGESGTGKELVAKAIHLNSSRSGPFVAVNCSAIPEALFESEFFGYERGAFSGADRRKIGKVQYAESGTLFLDEVGDMPMSAQVKLLRVLQEKTFTPLGCNRDIETNVRIIAATNANLEEKIEKGIFREDLFYRLNVIPIFLPPLRERKNDLETMLIHFIHTFNEKHNRHISSFSKPFLEALKLHDWPGNIRELENTIEHSFILEETNNLTPRSLPEKLLHAIDLAPMEKRHHNTKPLTLEDDRQWDFNVQKEDFEKQFIIQALKKFNGKINQTALHAKIPKKTLLRKMKKYGIRSMTQK